MLDGLLLAAHLHVPFDILDNVSKGPFRHEVISSHILDLLKLVAQLIRFDFLLGILGNLKHRSVGLQPVLVIGIHTCRQNVIVLYLLINFLLSLGHGHFCDLKL